MKKKKDESNRAYKCPCGYVYDPKAGSPETGIPKGIAFSALPEDWCCPRCGYEKQFFMLVCDSN